MTVPRPIPRLLALAAACATALVPLAAPAAAQTGGLQAGEALITASPALVGQTVRFSGTLGAGAGGRVVAIELRPAGGDWTAVASTTTARDGAFRARWRATTTGRFDLRARPLSPAVAAQGVSVPTGTATILRGATATWYDQSGSRGACGVRLRKRTIGVAHRTLPCGTRVTIAFRGRSLEVPVVDRGPFVRGVHYDVTIEVARRLGFVRAGRVRVGVLPSTEASRPTALLPVPSVGADGGVGAR